VVQLKARTPATFAHVAEALYGNDYRQRIADDLGVNRRSVARWIAGEFNIPPNVWNELADICADHGAELAKLAKDLRQ
jgi:phage-related protein